MAENAKFHLKDGREVMFSALRISSLHRRTGELIFGFVAILLLALALLALSRGSSDRIPSPTSSKRDASATERAGG